MTWELTQIQSICIHEGLGEGYSYPILTQRGYKYVFSDQI